MKADDVKLALLLLKTMPISNNKNVVQDAPAKLFYRCQLKAHLPVKRKQAVIQNLDDDMTSEVPSKYSVGEEVWVKLDTNTKWMPGKIDQVLPNQSYTIKMMDGRIFRRNEHHVTTRHDKVPNGQMCQLRCPNNNNNVPTIYDQGKIKCYN